MTNKQFTITKRIAKHGRQAIIVLPTILQEQLQPGMVVQISLEVIELGDRAE
jgi:hypothetical protein